MEHRLEQLELGQKLELLGQELEQELEQKLGQLEPKLEQQELVLGQGLELGRKLEQELEQQQRLELGRKLERKLGRQQQLELEPKLVQQRLVVGRKLAQLGQLVGLVGPRVELGQP